MATSSPPASTPEKPQSTAWGRRWLRLLEPTVLLGPAGIWLALLLVIPTLLILDISLVPGLKPGEAAGAYGLNNYLRIFEETIPGERIYLEVIGRSLSLAINCTLICLVLGFPIAYWIALKSPKRWQNLLLLGFVLPLWTSSLLRDYAWITILRRTGVLNSLLTSIGLPPQGLLYTYPAVLIGLSYSFLPYMVLILYASLEKLDKRLLEAAADLGANARQAFLKVTIPQTLPGIAAACLLVFITSLGDFVAPELLGGNSSMTVARLIYDQFFRVRNWGFGSSLSVLLILAVSISIALLIKYGQQDAESN